MTVTVTDKSGLMAPRADNHIHFDIEGPGEIVATDNGDPTSFESFQSHDRKAFNGLCLVIVRGKAGAAGKDQTHGDGGRFENSETASIKTTIMRENYNEPLNPHGNLFVRLMVALFACVSSAERGKPEQARTAPARMRPAIIGICLPRPAIRKRKSGRKLIRRFEQLFHGNPETQTVYYFRRSNSNGPLAYITDIKHNDVRTEGLSYGMIIAVELNKKAEFDALWNWSKTYLYVTETNHPSFGFFAWQARTNGVRMSQFVAPDGEEYYVTALYFAAHRWGNGKGIYNYKAQADELLSRMRHRESISGEVSIGGIRTGR